MFTDLLFRKINLKQALRLTGANQSSVQVIYSFETQFFIFSAIKNTGRVLRVIGPHRHVGSYKVRAPES